MSLSDDADALNADIFMDLCEVHRRLALKAMYDILRQREYAKGYRERNKGRLAKANTERMRRVRQAIKAKAADADTFAE